MYMHAPTSQTLQYKRLAFIVIFYSIKYFRFACVHMADIHGNIAQTKFCKRASDPWLSHMNCFIFLIFFFTIFLFTFSIEKECERESEYLCEHKIKSNIEAIEEKKMKTAQKFWRQYIGIMCDEDEMNECEQSKNGKWAMLEHKKKTTNTHNNCNPESNS